MDIKERKKAQIALISSLLANIVFTGGIVVAWSQEFNVLMPLRLSGLLMIAGLMLSVVSGIFLFRISQGAGEWWKRAGASFTVALILTSLPPLAMLSFLIYINL
jgi:hypothetical protein